MQLSDGLLIACDEAGELAADPGHVNRVRWEHLLVKVHKLLFYRVRILYSYSELESFTPHQNELGVVLALVFRNARRVHAVDYAA